MPVDDFAHPRVERVARLRRARRSATVGEVHQIRSIACRADGSGRRVVRLGRADHRLRPCSSPHVRAAPGFLVLARGAAARVRLPADRPLLPRRVHAGDLGCCCWLLVRLHWPAHLERRRSAANDSRGGRLRLSRGRARHRHLRVPHVAADRRAPKIISSPAARSGRPSFCCRSSART